MFMNNYVLRNIIIFLCAGIATLLSFGAMQYLSLDQEVIQLESKRLDQVNAAFSSSIPAIVGQQFQIVEFFASTTYPKVALELAYDTPFFTLLEKLNKQKVGVVLLDSLGNIVSHRLVNPEVISIFAGRKMFLAPKKNSFVSNNQFFTFFPIFFDSDQHKVLGYLGGIISLEEIDRTIQFAYHEMTASFSRLRPAIEVVFPNEASLNGQLAGMDVRYRISNPLLTIFEYDYRRLLMSGSVGLLVLILCGGILRYHMKKPFEIIEGIVKYISNTDQNYHGILPKDPLFRSIGVSLVKMHNDRAVFEKERMNRTMNEKMGQAAAQVAHDIRSPLMALKVVTRHLSEVAEEKRLMIRNSVQRIEDIANDLAERKQRNAINQVKQEALTVQLLSSLIEPLISEKRTQFRLRLGVQIHSLMDAQLYGVFAKVQPAEFKRILSNIINNAVEALPENGNVTIAVDRNADAIQISVSDNGKGIPAAVLPQLMKEGATFGKAEGSGLGLFHARTKVESWGGSVRIESKVGQGTCVNIQLPTDDPPAWFVPEICISPGSTIAIIDDDVSIHQVWEERLSGYSVHLQHFTSDSGVQNYHRENSNTQFLCDYEFHGRSYTGIDLIERLGIQQRAILVTSHYEEPGVQQRCAELSIKLIPKGLAGLVPIRMREAG